MSTDSRATQAPGHRNRLLVHFAAGPAWSRQAKYTRRYDGKPPAFIGGCPPNPLAIEAIDAAIAADKKGKLSPALYFKPARLVFIVPDVAYGTLGERAGVLEAYLPKAKKALADLQSRSELADVEFCRRCLVNLENMRTSDAKREKAHRDAGDWPPGSFRSAIKRSRPDGTKPGQTPVGVPVGAGVATDARPRAAVSSGRTATRERNGVTEKGKAAIGWKADPDAPPDPRQLRANARLAKQAAAAERRAVVKARRSAKKVKR